MEMNLKYLATATRRSDKYTLLLLDASECPEMLDTCFGVSSHGNPRWPYAVAERAAGQEWLVYRYENLENAVDYIVSYASAEDPLGVSSTDYDTLHCFRRHNLIKN